MSSPLAVANGANFALGVFLLTLAAIVLRRSPERAARGPLAAFLALAGLNYALDAVAFGIWSLGGDPAPVKHLAIAAALLDLPMLLAFALVVAEGPLTRVRAVLLGAPALLLLLLYAVFPPPVPQMSEWAFRPLYLGQMASYYLLAFAFLAQAYVRETRTLQRDRLAMLVIAFGLVCLPRIPLMLVDFGFPSASGTYLPLGITLTMIGALGAMVLAAWGFLHVSTRGEPHHRHVTRTMAAFAGLCGAIAAQWTLLFVPGVTDAAYSLLFSFRWLLFAAVFSAGLQRYDLLDLSDAARAGVRTTFGAVLLTVAVAQLASLLLVFPDATPPSALAGSIGIVAVVGFGRAAIRRATRGPPDDAAWRRQTLYRTHVELGAPPDELARLRERLRLSEREAREAEELVALELAAPAPATELEEGRVLLDRYEAQRFLGAGSFGRAFLAWDRHAGERVVLKELLEGWRESPEALARFRREAETALRFQHPNLVAFRGLVRTSRGHVLVLEYVEGERLRERLARGRLTPDEARRLAEDLLAGLAALHDAGIVHRDVKPDNVILRPDGRAVLLDFGAATDGTRGTVLVAGAGNPGTRAYMPPEQARGERVGPAADCYALAATLWEALAGEPTPGGSVPAPWRDVLERALHADPARRCASAAEFRRALVALKAP